MSSRYENAVSYEGWRSCRVVRIDTQGNERLVTTILEHVAPGEGGAIATALNEAYRLGRIDGGEHQ